LIASLLGAKLVDIGLRTYFLAVLVVDEEAFHILILK